MEYGTTWRKAAWITIMGTALAVAGCGGGSDGVSVNTGVFVDSPVQGLAYTSGATTGFTDAMGTFQYETGQPVTFSLGSVIIGEIAAGKATVYPTDLVAGATDEKHPTVSNIVRFLQTLDDDGDPSDRILITEKVRKSLTMPLNFKVSSAEFTTNAEVAAAVAAATPLRSIGVGTLKDAASAEEHFKFTLLAAFAGNWAATYGDTVSPQGGGTCSISVSDQGAISGTCTDFQFNETEQVGGSVQSGGSAEVSGFTSGGATFSGQFTRTGTASGTWSNLGEGSAGIWNMRKN